MRRAVALFATAGLAASSLMAIGATSPAAAVVSGPLSFRGVSVVSALPTAAASSTFSPTHEFAADQEHSRGTVSAPASAGGTASVPSPRLTRVVSAGSSMVASFQGLNHYDQRTANGGNQYSLEPPDQGLCVGNGNVLESVNDVMKVYSTTGAARSAVVDLNTFFKLSAQIDRTTNVPGEFLSDPKCYFDTETGRFFFTILEEDAAPSTNAYTLIAASKSGDPLGAWNIFWLNATDDGTGGTPSHPDCPCFGDQPLIGADHYGFYVTTNEFPDFLPGFNGAQVYAMSKTALENGVVPAVQQFDNLPLAEGPAYSLQPATSPTADSFSRAAHGTEYMLSALDFNATVDNRIAVWTLSNTSSLNSAHPALRLTSQVLRSESYGQPPVADQKPGDHPFGQLGAAALYGGAVDQPMTTLNTNDDRMNQVVYVRGSLWSAVNTVVAQPGGARKAGIAWFRVGVDADRAWSGRLGADRGAGLRVGEARERALPLDRGDPLRSGGPRGLARRSGLLPVGGVRRDGPLRLRSAPGGRRRGGAGRRLHRLRPVRHRRCRALGRLLGSGVGAERDGVDRERVCRAVLHGGAVLGRHHLRWHSHGAGELVDQGERGAPVGLDTACVKGGRRLAGPPSRDPRPAPSCLGARRPALPSGAGAPILCCPAVQTCPCRQTCPWKTCPRQDSNLRHTV